jgi:hypothetical protein
MTNPYPAPALQTLLAQVNHRWPNRSKASDGWIGDTAHSSRVSDHNPNDVGAVLARDYTRDGIDPYQLIEAAKRDPRTRYIIFDRVIYFVDDGFLPHPYNGPNAHEKHIHISVRHDWRYWNDPAPWPLTQAAVPLPELETDPMPDIRKYSRRVPQELSATEEETILLSDDGGTVSAKFGAQRFSTALHLALTGLPKGEEVQVRAVRTDASGKALGTYGTIEAVGTGGTSYAGFAWNDDLPAGQRLRFYIRAFREGVAIANARVTTLSWNL